MLTQYKTTLSDKKLLAESVYLFKFKLIEPTNIDFIPGQYLMLRVPKDGGYISRLYSVASPASQKDSFELLIELIPNGLASCFIDKLKIGDEVLFQGPAGLFKMESSEKRKVFLVTGTGIAPVISMIKSQTENLKCQIDIFWGLKQYKDAYLLEEFKSIQSKNPGLKFNICLSREQGLEQVSENDRNYFELGHVDSVFEKITNLDSLINAEYYLCGGREVVESLRQFLLSKNIPKEAVHFEKF